MCQPRERDAKCKKKKKKHRIEKRPEKLSSVIIVFCLLYERHGIIISNVNCKLCIVAGVYESFKCHVPLN